MENIVPWQIKMYDFFFFFNINTIKITLLYFSTLQLSHKVELHHFLIHALQLNVTEKNGTVSERYCIEILSIIWK